MQQTHAPLPQRSANIDLATGNNGLYFSKFFNQWVEDFSETIKDHSIGQGADKTNYHNGKMSWLLSVIHGRPLTSAQFETGTPISNDSHRIGNARDIDRQVAAARSLAKSLRPPDCVLVPLVFRTAGPFVTGMGLSHPVENGFLWHHTLGVPYLPGSSVKGMIRACAYEWCGAEREIVGRLFGRGVKNKDGTRNEDGPAVGQIIVFDALPIRPVQLVAEVITPHTGDWRITKTPQKSPPADRVSLTPIPFLAVDTGQDFQFALAPRAGAEAGDLETAYEFLAEAQEWLGAGAKTAIGFGRFDDLRKLPPTVGDKVRIAETSAKQHLHGKEGVIEKVLSNGFVKLKLDKGGKGSNPVVQIADLRRA